MKTKKDFLAFELFFQIGTLGAALAGTALIPNLNIFASIAISFYIYLSKVSSAVEISYLDYKINEAAKNSSKPESNQ